MNPKLDKAQHFASKLNSKMGKLVISSVIIVIVIGAVVVVSIQARPGIEEAENSSENSKSSGTWPNFVETTTAPTFSSSESSGSKNENKEPEHNRTTSGNGVIVDKGKINLSSFSEIELDLSLRNKMLKLLPA